MGTLRKETIARVTCWELKSHLFKASVLPTFTYGIEVRGGDLRTLVFREGFWEGHDNAYDVSRQSVLFDSKFRVSSMRDKFPLLFPWECSSREPQVFIFHSTHQVDIGIYLTEATALHHSKNQVVSKPPRCIYSPIKLLISQFTNSILHLRRPHIGLYKIIWTESITNL